MSIIDILHPAPKILPGMSVPRTQSLHALQVADGSAKAHIKEEPGNLGYDVEFWQRLAGGQPRDSYCMEFFFYCEVKAYCWIHGLLTGANADENRSIMAKQAGAVVKATGVPRTGSCRAFWDSQKALGRQRDIYFNPLPGDAAVFDWGAGIHHVGRIKEVLKDGRLVTIEANTGPDANTVNQGDGDGIYQRVRTRKSVAGFVHFS